MCDDDTCCVGLRGQLLSVIYETSKHSLPSMLRCLFDWYDRQNPMDEAGNCLYRRSSKIKGSAQWHTLCACVCISE